MEMEICKEGKVFERRENPKCIWLYKGALIETQDNLLKETLRDALVYLDGFL